MKKCETTGHNWNNEECRGGTMSWWMVLHRIQSSHLMKT